jgi:RNA 3'-terminal phosphate cyclase (ATP)
LIEVDGARGEGGGQVLRTSLSLSCATGKPFRIVRIREARPRPGLLPQHLAAVRAAAEISSARVEGAVPRSRELLFFPSSVRGGARRFAVGTAGSATLVLQTVLPPLLLAREPSRIEIEGGTHNPAAPPFEFLDRAFLPLLRRMGARVSLSLLRRGFFPAGGGRIRAEIEPCNGLVPVELLRRGTVLARRALAVVQNLPEGVAERELEGMRKRLGDPIVLRKEVVAGGTGPGNAVILEVECEEVTEVFSAFGERRVPAEAVAGAAADEALEYLAADVPVGRRLADQLLLPLALAGGGRFRTLPLTPHSETNAAVLGLFLGVSMETSPLEHGNVECRVTAR